MLRTASNQLLRMQLYPPNWIAPVLGLRRSLRIIANDAEHRHFRMSSNPAQHGRFIKGRRSITLSAYPDPPHTRQQAI